MCIRDSFKTAVSAAAVSKPAVTLNGGSKGSASKFQHNSANSGGTSGGSGSAGGGGTRSVLNSHFRSSSSQTTFLDRNIVQNLSVEQGAAPVNTSSSKLSSVGGRTTTTVATGGGAGGYARRRRPKTVPASYTSGSGSVKRASFSGTLPDGK